MIYYVVCFHEAWQSAKYQNFNFFIYSFIKMTLKQHRAYRTTCNMNDVGGGGGGGGNGDNNNNNNNNYSLILIILATIP
jgi:hypothetical protein